MDEVSNKKVQTLYIKISKDHFANIDVVQPPGDWFTDVHLQEVLVAFADNFSELYTSNTPKVFRTPRCSFSITSYRRTFKSYIYQPIKQNEGLRPIYSIPKQFSIRILGRADVAEALSDQTTLDRALRIIPPHV